MRLFVLLILLGGLMTGGCVPSSESEEPEKMPHIEGTPQDLRILRLEGIRNPDSPQGQRRLWQLKRDREELQKILKEAEDQNLR